MGRDVFADFLALFMDCLVDRMDLFVNEYSSPDVLDDMCSDQIYEECRRPYCCVLKHLFWCKIYNILVNTATILVHII